MKQLTHSQAEAIAERAGNKGMGFGPFTGPVPKGATCEDIARIARNAAFIALQEAGCLASADAADSASNARLADNATRRHRDWCRQTGSRC